MVKEEILEAFERVVDDQDICIGCSACVAQCPHKAWELDENNKARLIWDRCKDDFICLAICPVSCIWRASEVPDETKKKKGWYRFSRELTAEEKKIFEEWCKKHDIPL
jgi:ferredoxin